MQTTDRSHNFVQKFDNVIYFHYSLLGAHVQFEFKENIFTESFPQVKSLFNIVAIQSFKLGYKDLLICFVGNTTLLTYINFFLMLKEDMC